MVAVRRDGEHFARHAEDSAYNAHYDRPAVLTALGDVRGRRVLDAACGPGLYTVALLDAGAQVVGFDASEVMVDLARRRLGQRASIDVARLGDLLPYPAATFDLAVCALAIHYVEDRPAAFVELHRVLRPGGALVLSTQHPTADWLRKGGSYFERALETDEWSSAGGQVVRFWREPLSDLCAAATAAGFVIDLLDEPRPAESMRVRYPDDYAKLSREPGFLVLRLRKQDIAPSSRQRNSACVRRQPRQPIALRQRPTGWFTTRGRLWRFVVREAAAPRRWWLILGGLAGWTTCVISRRSFRQSIQGEMGAPTT